jgi:hypothetical protein
LQYLQMTRGATSWKEYSMPANRLKMFFCN